MCIQCVVRTQYSVIATSVSEPHICGENGYAYIDTAFIQIKHMIQEIQFWELMGGSNFAQAATN